MKTTITMLARICNPCIPCLRFTGLSAIAFFCIALTACTEQADQPKPATIGVYYYDGWSGRHRLADDPNEPWAKNAPQGLTKRFVNEFSGREPVWGWRNDTQEIMERQIDLAADNGIDFFAYCWYWRDNKGSINPTVIDNLPLHNSIALHLTAKNKNRLRYTFLVANHEGFEIIGVENWKAAVKFWVKYFRDPQFVTVDGKPLIIIFNPAGITNEDMAAMQEVARQEGFTDGIAIAGCRPSARQKSGFTYTTNYAVAPGAYNGQSEFKNYDILVEETKQEWKGSEQQPYIPLLTAGWDKRPWEGPDGSNTVEGWNYPDISPRELKTFLMDAIQWMNDHPKETTKEKIVLIYAWNELGEGGYLVPTRDDPEAVKLKAIGEVINGK